MQKKFIIVSLLLLLLSSCSRDARKALLVDIENATIPITLNVHLKEDKEILVDIDDQYSYFIEKKENTIIKIYDNQKLLFTKTYNGNIINEDDSYCIFLFNNNFYYLITYVSNGQYYYKLYEVAKDGQERILLNNSYENSVLNFGYIDFYLDSFDGSFYLIIPENEYCKWTIEQYTYEFNELEKISYWKNIRDLGKIQNIIHTEKEIIMVTTGGIVIRNFEYFTSGVSTSIFTNNDDKYYFYDLTLGDFGRASYLIWLNSLHDEHRTVGEKTVFFSSVLPNYVECDLYSYKKNAIIVFYTFPLHTSIKKSLYSVLIYNFDDESLSSFNITNERVSQSYFYNSKLYFESEKEGGKKILSYIDFKELDNQ